MLIEIFILNVKININFNKMLIEIFILNFNRNIHFKC